MSTIKSQTFTEVRINNQDPGTKLFNVTLNCALITAAVNATGTVLVSFRQSNTNAAWMTLPFALPGNYWAFDYSVGAVQISNTNGDMPNGVDFKIVAIAI